MMMMIEGLPLLALDAKGGVCSQFIRVGVVCISFFYLPMYLRIVDMYEFICVV
jgi:hypothetical protein